MSYIIYHELYLYTIQVNTLLIPLIVQLLPPNTLMASAARGPMQISSCIIYSMAYYIMQ